jgi:hypothetical protein
MFFTINHYLMALAVPAAVITAYGLSSIQDQVLFGRAGVISQKILIGFCYVLGIFILTVLMVFILNYSVMMVLISAAAIAGGMWFIIRSENIYKPACLLGGLIAFVYFQSPMLVEAGVTVHSTFQKIAGNVRADTRPFTMVIASHDIHEKEAQVYFDKEICKIANGSDQDMESEMRYWFRKDGVIYCMVLKKDYDRYYLKDVQNVSIFEEEYIFRKRLALDDQFFWSIVKLDQQKVKDYLMEKLYVLKKVPS